MRAMANPYLQLLDALYKRYGVNEVTKLRECLNREVAERDHRFDIIGKALYSFYLYMVDVDIRTIPSDVGDVIASVNGDLAALESEVRFALKEEYDSFLSEPMPPFVKGMNDVAALDEFEKKVHQKNLAVTKKILEDIEVPEARTDAAYKTAFEFLEAGGVADFLWAFKHLIYLVNIYNIIIPDADLANLRAGRADFVMMDGLSDAARDFLDNLDG